MSFLIEQIPHDFGKSYIYTLPHSNDIYVYDRHYTIETFDEHLRYKTKTLTGNMEVSDMAKSIELIYPFTQYGNVILITNGFAYKDNYHLFINTNDKLVKYRIPGIKSIGSTSNYAFLPTDKFHMVLNIKTSSIMRLRTKNQLYVNEHPTPLDVVYEYNTDESITFYFFKGNSYQTFTKFLRGTNPIIRYFSKCGKFIIAKHVTSIDYYDIDIYRFKFDSLVLINTIHHPTEKLSTDINIAISSDNSKLYIQDKYEIYVYDFAKLTKVNPALFLLLCARRYSPDSILFDLSLDLLKLIIDFAGLEHSIPLAK